jgi:2-iminobutanoate/2-iminopropanoate deaminase
METTTIKRMPTHCGDETCPSCVIAGDFIYLAHHAGGFDKRDIRHQMRAAFERAKSTLARAGATLNDMVQINLYLYDLSDFDGAKEVFYEYFDKGCFPARMTSTSKFLNAECLCMIDGVAYKNRHFTGTMGD